MKADLYQAMTKDQLIDRLILAEKEKIHLIELLDLKNLKLKELELQRKQSSYDQNSQENPQIQSRHKIEEKPKLKSEEKEKVEEKPKLQEKTKIEEKPEQSMKEQPKNQPSQSNFFFDETFSQDYYRLENNGQKATWLKGSTNNLYGDYQYWPSVRTRELISGVKQFKLTMPGYGWIGLGISNMKNDGFPGYTTEGWMLCTDGRVYHNKSPLIGTGISFQGKTVTVRVDAAKSEISIDGKAVKMGDNLPAKVHFVVSIFGSRTPYIEVQPL